MRYASPEMIKMKYYGLRHDVWGLGVLAYFLFCGEFPFKGNNELDLHDSILKDEPDWSLFKKKEIGPTIVMLIKKMLLKDPNDRATIRQIINSKVLLKFKEKEAQYVESLFFCFCYYIFLIF